MIDQGRQRESLHERGPVSRREGCVMDGCWGELGESDSFCDQCLYQLRWGAA